MHAYSIYTRFAYAQVEANRPANPLDEDVQRRVNPTPEPLMDQGNIPLIKLTPDRVHPLDYLAATHTSPLSVGVVMRPIVGVATIVISVVRVSPTPLALNIQRCVC